MAKNSAERLVTSTIKSRENPLFPAHSQHGVKTTLPSDYKEKMWYYAGFEGSGILFDPLYYCTAVHYLIVFYLANCAFVHTDESRDIRRKLHLLTLA